MSSDFHYFAETDPEAISGSVDIDPDPDARPYDAGDWYPDYCGPDGINPDAEKRTALLARRESARAALIESDRAAAYAECYGTDPDGIPLGIPLSLLGSAVPGRYPIHRPGLFGSA